MNSGCLLKWFVPVEVQDEERPTRPALLWSSTSHTSSTLMIQVESYYYSFSLWNEWKLWMVNALRGCVEAPFVAPKVGSRHLLIWELAPPPLYGSERITGRKCTWTGVCLGDWPPPFAGWLVSGPSLVYVGARVSFVGLLYFVGPLWKCDAGLDILCNCVATFVCFCLILRMGSCNPRIPKTHGNG